MEEFATQAASRQQVVDLLQYVSPSIVAQNALNAISGTGTERFTDFNEQVLAFHENWRGFFTNRIVKGERMTAAEFDEIPTFEYENWDVSDVLDSTGGPIVGLLLFVLVLSVWSSRRYAKYPVV